MLDNIENPGSYNPEAHNYKIIERYDNGLLREIKVLNITVEEKITWNEKTGKIRHTLVNNPLFIGQGVNAVVRPASNNPHEPLVISYTWDWEPYNEQGSKVAQKIQENIAEAVKQIVLNLKTVA